jgi:hypothetical protein
MVIYENSHKISSDLIRTLNGWWASVAGGAVPDRSLLDPVDFKELLPNIAIADVEPEPFRIRFRLVGTRIVNATGLSGRAEAARAW